jgi:4-amino-4-deoxychorismate lyase
VSGFIDVNGEVSTVSQASLSPLDRGFLLGDACFEVLKVKDQKFIFLEDHLDRLFSSLSEMGFLLWFSRSELQKKMENLLRVSGYSLAYFRITVTGGSSLGFSVDRETLKPNLYLFIKELKEEPVKPLSLKLIRASFTDRSQRIKTNNYGPSLKELALAKKEGFDEILWMNDLGEITEASASNVFFVKDKTAVTPSLDSGLLAGITRKNIISCLKKSEYKIFEKKIFEKDLKSFDSCFLTSSIKEITPVTYISDISFPSVLLPSPIRKFFGLLSS